VSPERRTEELVSPCQQWPSTRKAVLALAVRSVRSSEEHREILENIEETLLGPHGTAALAACQAVANSLEIEETVIDSLGIPERVILREMSQADAGALSVQAAVVLSNLGESIADQLPRFLVFKDEYARRLALLLAAREGSRESRDLLRRGLTDAD